MSNKKKKKKKVHPTLFALDGSIRYYKDGSMLELHSAITPNEWAHIIEETIKYKIFLECLKEIAFPILKEKWTKEDEWFRLQLVVSVSRMRNIDPLLVAKWDEEDIKKQYSKGMLDGATSLQELVSTIKDQQRETKSVIVSNL